MDNDKIIRKEQLEKELEELFKELKSSQTMGEEEKILELEEKIDELEIIEEEIEEAKIMNADELEEGFNNHTIDIYSLKKEEAAIIENNKELALKAIKYNPYIYLQLDLVPDKDIIDALLAEGMYSEIAEYIYDYEMEEIRKNWSKEDYESVFGDKEKALKFIRSGVGDIYSYLTEELRNDRGVFDLAYKYCDSEEIVEVIGKDLKNDKELFMKLLAENPWLIEFAGEELKSDKDIVYKALEGSSGRDCSWVAHIDEKFLKDEEFIKRASEIDEDVLDWVYEDEEEYEEEFDDIEDEQEDDREKNIEDEEFREEFLEAIQNENRRLGIEIDDRNLMMEAIRINPMAIRYASDELVRDDKELALIAVEYAPAWYMVLSRELQGDSDIIDKIFEHSADDIGMVEVCYELEQRMSFQDELILDSREQALKAVKANGNLFRYLEYDYRDDKEIFEAAYESGIRSEYLEAMGGNLWNDKELFMRIVKENPDEIYYASDDLKADRELVIEAACRDISVLEYVSEELQEDPSIMTEIMLRKVQEKKKLDKQNDEAKELLYEYEQKENKNGQTQSDED